uniref:G-patch domain-containing protein n=1 Tax=Panagrolaimus sp. PS1159 TaxID=55785 RepID=A0AC35F2R7_9BILA
MEEDGYESFDLNDADLEYALDPTRRGRRQQTREQQLYGIWADEDEEDNRFGFGAASSSKVELTKGVSFVSAGKTTDLTPDDTPKPEKRPRLNFQPSSYTNEGVGAQVFAGMRTTSTMNIKGSEWTQASGKSDVIMQMMKKMGYVEGKGLGTNKQGIVEPIVASVRAGRGAVGAYGKESSAVGQKFGETAAAAQAREHGNDELADTLTRKGNWKKDKRQKAKTQYKTIDDVIAEGGLEAAGIGGPSLNMKIIDMTGPQQKVYNDFHSFSRKAKAPELDNDRRKFDIPELAHNLDTLLDVTEDEIRRNDRQLKLLKDQNKSIEADSQEIRKAIIDEEKEVERMKEVFAVVEEFAESKNQTLKSCKDLLLRLKRDYAVEYKIYGLDSIALSNVMPMLRAHFNNWNPLNDADYGIEIVEEWKEILQGEGKEKKHMFDRMKSELDALPAFDRCIWESWMPAMRQAALRWNVKTESRQMIHAVLTWIPILPDWIADNLLEQIIVPKIKEQVDKWDPTTDAVPIDSWLLPWHPILGHRLMPVYSPIRQKLAKALRNWIATDESAITVLKPWNDVFTKPTMNSFLSINIVPKLEQALSMMNLNPLENNEFPEFQAVLNWIELIGSDIICQILMKCFFPKWLDTIVLWLRSPGMILSEVAKYYMEWSKRFPPSLKEIPSIKGELKRALDVIQQAKQNLPIQLAPAAFQQQPIIDQAPRFFNPPPIHSSRSSLPTASLREFIEHRAQQSGLVFMPLRKQMDGKPIYQLGGLEIFFDRDLLIAFNHERNRWEPIGVEHAFEIASNH